jgi:hypothetical protein
MSCDVVRCRAMSCDVVRCRAHYLLWKHMVNIEGFMLSGCIPDFIESHTIYTTHLAYYCEKSRIRIDRFGVSSLPGDIKWSNLLTVPGQ